jgi:hypothetical protein
VSEPLPPLPEPFAAQPRPLTRPGCGRAALLGCGVLVVLVGVGAVLLALNANRISSWLLHKLETTIAGKLQPEVPPADRARFSAAFAELYRAIEEGKVDPVAVQTLQRELIALSSQIDSGLSREQLQRLTEAVESAAGKAPAEERPGGAGAAPSPARPGAADIAPPPRPAPARPLA